MPVVNQHSARRQSYLGLETGWSSQGPLFRFFSCLLGVVIANSFLAAQYTSARDTPICKFDQSAFIIELTSELLGRVGAVDRGQAARFLAVQVAAAPPSRRAQKNGARQVCALL